MNYNSINVANKIYTCSSETKIIYHSISNPRFEEFCYKFKNFEIGLGEYKSEDYWKPFIKWFKRYRYDMCSAPISFSNKTICNVETIAKLKNYIKKSILTFPDHFEHANELVCLLEGLNNTFENPYLKFYRNFLNEFNSRIAFLIKESRLITVVENEVKYCFSYNEQIPVIGIREMINNDCFKKLLLVGPTQWYPKYIFNSPRAYEIIILNYDWIRNFYSVTPSFICNSDENVENIINGDLKKQFHFSSGVNQIKQMTVSNEKNIKDFYVTPDELELEINWNEISSKQTSKNDSDSYNVFVDARLCLLQNDRAVYLEDGENSKIIIIDIDGDDESEDEDSSKVKRILASNIQQGMFILLRTEGGGDYIIPIANKLMGSNAELARQYQKQWKQLLLNELKSKTFFELSISLLELGAKLVNEINLRNWTSEKNIKPSNLEDFKAIMKLINLEELTEEYWRYSRLIEIAHRKAGFKIRQMLLKQVLTSNLKELEKNGILEFKLQDNEGGSLTAFRVLSISPDKYNIAINHVGEIFNVNETDFNF